LSSSWKEAKQLTATPSQIEVVTLAVFLLGGDERPVDTEDVAVKAHEMAPSRFGWKKYPLQVNLELVRVYLSAAKKGDRGGLLEGSGKIGWSLTPRGKAWAQAAREHLLGKSLNRPREAASGGPVDEQKWRRERERIVTSAAWGKVSSGATDIDLKEAEAVFRIDSYAVGRLRTLKISRLQKLFEGDADVRHFLDQMTRILNTDQTTT
jgi:hypothetical protein